MGVRVGRYSQILNDPTRNWRNTPNRVVVPVKKVSSGSTIGFGTTINPIGQHINFAQPARSAIVGVTTIRAAPAYMGADLQRQYGLSQTPAPGNKYTQQFIKKLLVSLATTFTDVFYPISGTIFWYMTSTNPTDALLVRIGDLNADQLPFGPGNGIEGLSYNKVYLTNNVAVAGATATLVYFTDDPESPARFF